MARAICTFCINLTNRARRLLQTQYAITGVASDNIEIVAVQGAARDAHRGISRPLQDGGITFELAPDLPIVERDGETAACIVGDSGNPGGQLLCAPWSSGG